MRERLVTALKALHRDQQRVVVCAVALILTLLLPWYTKTTTVNSPIPFAPPQTTSETKLAILVPSFIEASILLVAIAVLVLMLLRGASANVVLPLPDRVLVTGAGAWSLLLVFWRFVDQPGSQGPFVDWSLSWGIFFGLLAALALIGSGLLLHDEGSATGGLHAAPQDEEAAPGRGPGPPGA